VLADWRTAPLAPKLHAALAFIEKLTLRPGELVHADIAALHAAGLDDDAIREAAHVCAGFNVIDRIADTLDFHIPSAALFARGAKVMLTRGYTF